MAINIGQNGSNNAVRPRADGTVTVETNVNKGTSETTISDSD